MDKNPEPWTIYETLQQQKLKDCPNSHLVSPDFSFNWLVRKNPSPVALFARHLNAENGNPLLNLIGTVSTTQS